MSTSLLYHAFGLRGYDYVKTDYQESGVKQLGRGVGMALVAAGSVLAGIVYAARKKIASVASAVYWGGRRLLGRAITSLASMMPSFVFGGT